MSRASMSTLNVTPHEQWTPTWIASTEIGDRSFQQFGHAAVKVSVMVTETDSARNCKSKA